MTIILPGQFMSSIYLSILSCLVNAIYIYQLPTDKTVLLQTFGPFCYFYWYLERSTDMS